MVPRRDVVFFEVDWPLAECLAVAERTKHTRYPVCRDSLDEVIGVAGGQATLPRYAEQGSLPLPHHHLVGVGRVVVARPIAIQDGQDLRRGERTVHGTAGSDGDVDVLPVALVVVATVVGRIEEVVLQDELVTGFAGHREPASAARKLITPV